MRGYTERVPKINALPNEPVPVPDAEGRPAAAPRQAQFFVASVGPTRRSASPSLLALDPPGCRILVACG